MGCVVLLAAPDEAPALSHLGTALADVLPQHPVATPAASETAPSLLSAVSLVLLPEQPALTPAVALLQADPALAPLFALLPALPDGTGSSAATSRSTRGQRSAGGAMRASVFVGSVRGTLRCSSTIAQKWRIFTACAGLWRSTTYSAASPSSALRRASSSFALASAAALVSALALASAFASAPAALSSSSVAGSCTLSAKDGAPRSRNATLTVCGSKLEIGVGLLVLLPAAPVLPGTPRLMVASDSSEPSESAHSIFTPTHAGGAPLACPTVVPQPPLPIPLGIGGIITEGACSSERRVRMPFSPLTSSCSRRRICASCCARV
mmetsp:Transcript_41509/g.88551  ORF Transcript_41509/g.88551 Transcript_41509/m.88551 type:complete len:323 (+) Transcript_41509:877-1845(+)